MSVAGSSPQVEHGNALPSQNDYSLPDLNERKVTDVGLNFGYLIIEDFHDSHLHYWQMKAPPQPIGVANDHKWTVGVEKQTLQS